jgi:hypothetical protein
MRPIVVAVLVALGAVVPFRPDAARAWWDTGHQIIAKVAADRLNPHAKTAVKTILKCDPTGKRE